MQIRTLYGPISVKLKSWSNRKGGTASLRSHTREKRNAVFGARFEGLSLYFLYQKGNLIRIKTGLDTCLIRIQTRTLLSRHPPNDYSEKGCQRALRAIGPRRFGGIFIWTDPFEKCPSMSFFLACKANLWGLTALKVLQSSFLVAWAIRNAIRANRFESFAIETPIFIARQADSPESLEFPIRANHRFARIVRIDSPESRHFH